jgi:hypothetical protein
MDRHAGGASVSGVYTRYFHKNILGSISAITDEAAHVERLSYHAWGKAPPWSGWLG